MEEIVIAIFKGGEIVADFCATVYEKVSSDDEADGADQEVRD